MPIANVGGNPYVIVVRTEKPFTKLADLVAYAKSNPGKLPVGHAGIESMSHLSASMFLHRADITATMVPYKGGNPALVDVLAGVADVYSANVSEILPHIAGGKLRFLAVSSESRIKQLPDVPTIAETYPGFAVETWNGLLGPAGMPAEAVDKLASEVTKAFSSTAPQADLDGAGFRMRLENAGVTP